VKADDRQPQQKIFVLPTKSIWLLGVICFCCTLGEGAMADWSSLYYMQVINELNKVSTVGYTAFAFTMAFGRLVGDKLLDRYGYRRILVMDSVFISAGLGLAIIALHPYMVILGFAMVGFGVATIIPIVYTLAGKNPNMPPGVALAAVSSIGFTGFLIGPPIIGFIAHLIGLRLAFLLPLLLAICVAFLSRYIKTS
jgi:MFS family permease